MWTEQERATIEKALYYARANVENYWHHWAGDNSESDSLEKIDAALEALTKLDQPAPQGEALDAQAGLAPCPFCGATEPTVEVQIESSYYCVGCNGCGCAHIMDTNRDDAIAAWNRRTSPVAQPDAPAQPQGDVPIVLEAGTPEHNAMIGVLADVMSNLSETAYGASWSIDCEYGIWQELQSGVNDWFIRDQLAVDQLKLLSGMIDGWIVWDDEVGDTRYVPIAEWYALYTTWLNQRRTAPDAPAQPQEGV